jgi:F420-dependent oxidoreductase-like protein
MKLSLLFPESRSLDAARDLAVRTEAQGFHGMWLGSAFGFDSFVAIALAGQVTSTLELGIAVVPTWPRHPIVMAQSAATASAACGGRFRLGIGPSHTPVMRMYGIEFDRPISHLREYLTIVHALLEDRHVTFDGARYQVMGFLDIADAPAPPVLLGVLQAQAARLAGGHADGALCWLGPASYLHDVIAPNIAVGADAAGRARPPLIAELPCALHTDRDVVHAMAARDLGIYPQMPFYRAIFESAGIAVTGKEWNDAMLDAAVLYGDEDGLAKKIQTFFDAGADEVVLSPFGVGDDPASSQADCIRVLSDLARGE